MLTRVNRGVSEFAIPVSANLQDPAVAAAGGQRYGDTRVTGFLTRFPLAPHWTISCSSWSADHPT